MRASCSKWVGATVRTRSATLLPLPGVRFLRELFFAIGLAIGTGSGRPKASVAGWAGCRCRWRCRRFGLVSRSLSRDSAGGTGGVGRAARAGDGSSRGLGVAAVHGRAAGGCGSGVGGGGRASNQGRSDGTQGGHAQQHQRPPRCGRPDAGVGDRDRRRGRPRQIGLGHRGQVDRGSQRLLPGRNVGGEVGLHHGADVAGADAAGLPPPIFPARRRCPARWRTAAWGCGPARASPATRARAATSAECRGTRDRLVGQRAHGGQIVFALEQAPPVSVSQSTTPRAKMSVRMIDVFAARLLGRHVPELALHAAGLGLGDATRVRERCRSR